MENIHLCKQDRDVIAAVLSVIPGLGHLYKHHFVAGFGIMFGGTALMVFIAFWLAFATAGLSLLFIPICYLIAIGYAAYTAEDRHHQHHYLHPWT